MNPALHYERCRTESWLLELLSHCIVLQGNARSGQTNEDDLLDSIRISKLQQIQDDSAILAPIEHRLHQSHIHFLLPRLYKHPYTRITSSTIVIQSHAVHCMGCWKTS